MSRCHLCNTGLPGSEIPSSSEDCTSLLLLDKSCSRILAKSNKASLTEETDAQREGETFVHCNYEEMLGLVRRGQSTATSCWGKGESLGEESRHPRGQRGKAGAGAQSTTKSSRP